MEDHQRRLFLRVGVVVVSAFLLTCILILRIEKVSLPFQEGRKVTVKFDKAPGVTEETPVRKNGILIGRVERVEFDPEKSGVIVTLDIHRKDAKLWQGEVCRITGSLLGDATLEFVPGETMPEKTEPLDLNEPQTGIVKDDPLELISSMKEDLKGTLTSMTLAGDEVTTLASNMNKMFEGGESDQFRTIMTKTETALDSFNLAMTDINDLMGDDSVKGSLKKTLADLPVLTRDMKVAIQDVRDVMTRADKNLANLEGLTEPLGESGPEIARKIESALGQFETVMSQLAVFTDRMNSDEGTLGQLMNNPELYDRVSSAAENIDQMTKDLRPIISDIRVFSDQIARDPGRLGLSGALDKKKSRTKYPKYPQVKPPPNDWREPLEED